MNGEEKPKRNIRRSLSIVFSLLVFAALAYIAVSLITGRSIGFSRLTDIFTPRRPVLIAEEFYFNIGRNRIFADLGDAIAAAGTLGIQVLDYEGNESFGASFRMSQPSIRGFGNRAIVFDIGGSAVRAFDRSRIITSLDINGAVISASMNQNGWFCVSTQEGVSYRGIVTVYDNTGKGMYKVSMGSGYVLSAELSHDNRALAILNLTETGSRIAFYKGIDTPKDEPDAVYESPGLLILDIRYLPGGDMLAISTDSLILIDKNGSAKELYSYPDKRIGGYTLDSGFITLYLLDFGVGHQGRIVSLLADGSLLGEVLTDREILSISSGDDYICILYNDRPVIFSKELEELPLAGEQLSSAGASRILAFGNDMALITGDHIALMITTESER